MLMEREQYWMDSFNSYGEGGYNCSIMAHRAINKYGNMVSEKVMLKNGHYLQAFLDNMALMPEYEVDLPDVMISFFGFNLNKSSKEAIFKRAWQCSNIILCTASDIRYLDPSKEYRLNGITFTKDGEYNIEENTAVKSPLHNQVKTNDVVSRMKQDLITKLEQTRHGKYILLKWRELESEDETN